MTDVLLDRLNPEQKAAVTLPHESALILAGAGSGKTRVLTTRIAWLIQTGQVSPLGVLAVTFTNKAAKEMLTRLSAMMTINTRGMWVGTFHGLANRLLRAHFRDAGLPQTFQILDSQDQQSAVKRLLKGLNVDTEKYEPKKVQWWINAAKEAGLRAQDTEAYDGFSQRLNEFYAAYDEQCQREGVVDFAELLLRSYELMIRNELLRNHYQSRFRHILIDEFQDTNKLQYKWLKQFAGPYSVLFAVGDDDQSIYAFRGAHTGNMQEFEREYAHGRVIKLEQNYRSHGHILDAANALIAQNRERLGKNLWTAEGEGEKLRVFEGYTDQEEAAFVVDEVRQLNREGAALSEMAVLYRSNAQSRVIEHALFTAGVAYRVYGGLRFFERQEVKHALAYLRLMANPEDDGAFLRVVNFPARGIGARTLEMLQVAARSVNASLWQAAVSQGGKLLGFVGLIGESRRATEGLSLAETIEHLIEASGLGEYYRNDKDGADRLENLAELVNAAALFEQDPDNILASRSTQTPPPHPGPLPQAGEGDEAGLISREGDGAGLFLREGDKEPVGVESNQGQSVLASFLAHASLEAGENQANAGQDAVQLMTVHAAKGLEFHSVFITGLEEGLFPHEQSFAEKAGLEEERRLMYVALTRARRRLYLTHAQSRMLHGQVRYGIPSRFLAELPDGVVRNLNRRVSEARAVPSYAPTPRRDNDSGFRIGQSVAHAKFGAGVILDVEGRGADARVQVKFRDVGVKWLALAYANLTPA